MLLVSFCRSLIPLLFVSIWILTVLAYSIQKDLSLWPPSNNNIQIQPTEFDAKLLKAEPTLEILHRTVMDQYPIAAGDSFYSIAQKFGSTPDGLQELNSGVIAINLQIGQLINVPGTASHASQSPQHPQSVLPQQAQLTYIIRPGDTFYSIAARCGFNDAQLQSLNPGINPSTIQVGQTIKVPQTVGTTPPLQVGGGYVHYSGPASSFPNPGQWASYDTLWASNFNLMQHSDSSDEISIIASAIQSTASESGIDSRAILCLMMQESGGNVRVGSTASWQDVHNTGIMQAHNGAVFNPSDPAGSIKQMVSDGIMGTASGDGLKQCFAHQGNYYAAFREYNSGRMGVNVHNLSDGIGATGDYVEMMANRFMGLVWDGM